MERKYRLPAERAFSFVDEVMLRRRPPEDTGTALLAACSSLEAALFELLGATGPTVTTTVREEDKEPVGPFAFPVERQSSSHRRGAASYRVTLERMFNGHLGCNEDDLTLELAVGAARVRGRCYLYTGDTFTLSFEETAAPAVEKLSELFVGALGLVPPEHPAG